MTPPTSLTQKNIIHPIKTIRTNDSINKQDQTIKTKIKTTKINHTTTTIQTTEAITQKQENGAIFTRLVLITQTNVVPKTINRRKKSPSFNHRHNRPIIQTSN
jgi:hypothetical protein